MNLQDYFENTQGKGILSTADKSGKIDAAVYARPHFKSENNCYFIMADRLSHNNLQTNPRAVYLFMEDSEHYQGKRLYLTKVNESEDRELIDSLRISRRSCPVVDDSKDKKSFLVEFRVDSVRPLVGDEKIIQEEEADV